MKTSAAPSNAWEVRMRWGDRALEAEVVDGRGKKSVTLGDQPHDAFVIVDGTRIEVTWNPQGVEVCFSTGLTGTATLQGEAPAPLATLVSRGAAKERGAQYALQLSPGDSVEFHAGAGQIIDVRPAKGRVARLELDLVATIALVGALGLLAAWIAVTLAGMTPLNLLGK